MLTPQSVNTQAANISISSAQSCTPRGCPSQGFGCWRQLGRAGQPTWRARGSASDPFQAPRMMPGTGPCNVLPCVKWACSQGFPLPGCSWSSLNGPWVGAGRSPAALPQLMPSDASVLRSVGRRNLAFPSRCRSLPFCS